MSNAKTRRPLADEDLERVARHFRLLGEPMRLKILQALCRKPLAVGDIVASTGAAQANVSRHLALMAAAGILTRKKNGQRVLYGMKDRLAVQLCELVRAQMAG